MGDAIGPLDDSEPSSADQITIPIAAMATVVIVAVCATVSLLTLYKWRWAMEKRNKKHSEQNFSCAWDLYNYNL